MIPILFFGVLAVRQLQEEKKKNEKCQNIIGVLQ